MPRSKRIDYTGAIASLMEICQLILAETEEYLNNGKPSTPATMQRAAAFMDEEKRLADRKNGAVWNLIFGRAIRNHVGYLPQVTDFSVLVDCEADTTIRQGAARRIHNFFESVFRASCWYNAHPSNLEVDLLPSAAEIERLALVAPHHHLHRTRR